MKSAVEKVIDTIYAHVRQTGVWPTSMTLPTTEYFVAANEVFSRDPYPYGFDPLTTLNIMGVNIVPNHQGITLDWDTALMIYAQETGYGNPSIQIGPWQYHIRQPLKRSTW